MKMMKTLKIMLLCVLAAGLSACTEDDPYDVESYIVGRSWTGDVGMADEYGEPLISTFTFGRDGFGEEVQRYATDGMLYDRFRFSWHWEDCCYTNMVLDYGRFGVSYMDGLEGGAGRLRGMFYIDGNSKGYPFVLYME